MVEDLKTQMSYIWQEVTPHIKYDSKLTAELKILRDMVLSIETADFGIENKEVQSESTPQE